MARSQAARRYAEALVEATKPDEYAVLREEITRFTQTTEQVFDLKNVLLNPVFTVVERTQALDASMEDMKLSERTRRFLRLVVDRDRVADLEDIAEEVRRQLDAREGKVRAKIQSAAELSAASQELLRKALERRTGRKIDLEVVVDPALIGGIRAQVGSMVFDGTIRTELARLGERLRGAELSISAD